MSIQVYECPGHHRDEVFLRGLDVPQTRECPCGETAALVISAPSTINIKRDWNDQASDMQRDPYTQAKAQLTNLDRERQEREGTPPMKITETMIQAGAKAIYEDKRTPPKGAVQRTVAAKNRGRKQTKQP